MSRLGVLYALTDEELAALCAEPAEERYDYMLEEIEEELLGTPRGFELDKAWEGIHLCFCGGVWIEENQPPVNILAGGEFLVDTDEELISLKDHSQVEQIAEYLRQHKAEDLIRENFPKVEAMKNLPVYVTDLEYLLGNVSGLQDFYENARQQHLQVIFTVDL